MELYNLNFLFQCLKLVCSQLKRLFCQFGIALLLWTISLMIRHMKRYIKTLLYLLDIRWSIKSESINNSLFNDFFVMHVQLTNWKKLVGIPDTSHIRATPFRFAPWRHPWLLLNFVKHIQRAFELFETDLTLELGDGFEDGDLVLFDALKLNFFLIFQYSKISTEL